MIFEGHLIVAFVSVLQVAVQGSVNLFKCICLLVFRSTKDADSFNLKIPRGILIPQMFFSNL